MGRAAHRGPGGGFLTGTGGRLHVRHGDRYRTLRAQALEGDFGRPVVRLLRRGGLGRRGGIVPWRCGYVRGGPRGGRRWCGRALRRAAGGRPERGRGDAFRPGDVGTILCRGCRHGRAGRIRCGQHGKTVRFGYAVRLGVVDEWPGRYGSPGVHVGYPWAGDERSGRRRDHRGGTPCRGLIVQIGLVQAGLVQVGLCGRRDRIGFLGSLGPPGRFGPLQDQGRTAGWLRLGSGLIRFRRVGRTVRLARWFGWAGRWRIGGRGRGRHWAETAGDGPEVL
jgi:hypothetical protein